MNAAFYRVFDFIYIGLLERIFFRVPILRQTAFNKPGYDKLEFSIFIFCFYIIFAGKYFEG